MQRLAAALVALSAVPASTFAPTAALPRRSGPRRGLRAAPADEYDVVVIGSGIGGLSCASICAQEPGLSVCVLEQHYEPGGAAHEFCFTFPGGKPVPRSSLAATDAAWRFEAGPSLYSGLKPDLSPNPMSHVFDMIGEVPEYISYAGAADPPESAWGYIVPEVPEGYAVPIGARDFGWVLDTAGGPNAREEWQRIVDALLPLADGVMGYPTVALRPDPGALVTALKYAPAVAKAVVAGPKLVAPFGTVLEELDIQDAFIKNYLDMICFLLQGTPASSTLTAVMAYMMDDLCVPPLLLLLLLCTPTYPPSPGTRRTRPWTTPWAARAPSSTR